MKEKKPSKYGMPWYGWFLSYGIIIPFFALGILVEAEMPWWFVPGCIATITLCVFGIWATAKYEQKKERSG